jgi:ribosomal protein L37AE/L43A
MRHSQTASRPKSLDCPLCGSSELRPVGHDCARCVSCSGFVQGWTLEFLCQVAALPDALGGHACECGHPEMRRLPDGVFHCPACGSEVLPLDTPLTARSKTAARRIGFREMEQKMTFSHAHADSDAADKGGWQ